MSYRLLLLKVSEEWAHKLSERLAQCPRIFFLSKLKDNRVVVGLYAEDSRTLKAQIDFFKKVVGKEGLDTHEIEEVITPYWEFEVLDEEKEQTCSQLIECAECPVYNRCFCCSGTILIKEGNIRNQYILQH